MFPLGDQQVVIDLQVPLPVVQVLAARSAAGEITRDLNRRGRGQGKPLRPFPGVANACFVQEIGAGHKRVAEAEIILAYPVCVTGLSQGEAAGALIPQIADIR